MTLFELRDQITIQGETRIEEPTNDRGNRVLLHAEDIQYADIPEEIGYRQVAYIWAVTSSIHNAYQPALVIELEEKEEED